MKENTQKTKVKLERIIYEVTIDSVRTTKKNQYTMELISFYHNLKLILLKLNIKMKEHQLFLLH